MLCRNIIKFLALAVLVLMFCESTVSTQRFCGKTLTQAMDKICVNGYKSKIKKSMDMENLDESYNEIEDDDDSQYPLTWYPNSPFLSKVFGVSDNFMAKTRRRRHGIYDECCVKPCTYKELYSYCL